MDAETLEALRGSIKKWELIVSGEGEDYAWSNCPLCLKFNGDTVLVGCEGCPVFQKTGLKICLSSPYEEWDRHHDDVHDNEEIVKIYCPICQELAQAELDFLKSLLPKEDA